MLLLLLLLLQMRGPAQRKVQTQLHPSQAQNRPQQEEIQQQHPQNHQWVVQNHPEQAPQPQRLCLPQSNVPRRMGLSLTPLRLWPHLRPMGGAAIPSPSRWQRYAGTLKP